MGKKLQARVMSGDWCLRAIFDVLWDTHVDAGGHCKARTFDERVLEYDVRYHGDRVHLLYILIIINMSIIPEHASFEVRCRAGKYRIGAESGWAEPTIGESSPEPAPLRPSPTGDLPPPPCSHRRHDPSSSQRVQRAMDHLLHRGAQHHLLRPIGRTTPPTVRKHHLRRADPGAIGRSGAIVEDV